MLSKKYQFKKILQYLYFKENNCLTISIYKKLN